MTREQVKKIEQINSAAREAICCAIGAQAGSVSAERSRQSLDEFRRLVSADPVLWLDLTREWSSVSSAFTGGE